MADNLNTLIAQGPGKFDFAALADPVKGYWEGLDQRNKQESRDLFKGGLPKDAAGNVDWNKVNEVVLQQGGAPAAIEVGKLQNQRDLQTALQKMGTGVFGGGGASEQPTSTVLPPSTSRNIPLPDAQDNPRSSPGDFGGGATIMGMALARSKGDAGRAQQMADLLSKSTGIHPDEPLNDPAKREVVIKAAPAVWGGQQAQGGPAAPQPAPPMSPAPAQAAPPGAPQMQSASVPGAAGGIDIGGLSERDLPRLRQAAALAASSGVRDAGKVYIDAIDAIQKRALVEREAQIKERMGTVEPQVKQVIERVGKSQDKADSTADGILVSHDLMAQLDAKAGIFSGQWAKEKLALAKVGKAIGLDLAPEQIANTEAFSALVGKKVAQTVRAFGSGTSITNQDREYAEKMEAGNIKLDETSIRRILTITDKINRGIIDKHNQAVDSLIRSRPALRDLRDTMIVEQPPAYKRTQAAPAPAAPPPNNAPGGRPSIVNPKTGQVMMLDPTGTKWVPGM